MLSQIAWNAAMPSVHAVILPIPFCDVLKCYALEQLIYKVQKYMLKHFIQLFSPNNLNRFLLFTNQPDGQLAHKFFSRQICLIALNQTRWSSLTTSMALYIFYMNVLTVVLSKDFLKSFLPSCVYTVGSNTYDYLFPLKIKETVSHKKNAEKIKILTEEVEKIIDDSNISDYVEVDPITLDPPSLPVEIDTRGHFLDANSLRMYQGKTCPLCREELSPRDYVVSTKTQEKILKQLQEAL